MLIRKKHIRSVGNNIRGVERGEIVVVALRELSKFHKSVRRVGFSKQLKAGETVLPAAIGPVSTFNAEGKYKVHKDQPKEIAYRLSVWRWKEFRGRYDTVDRSKIVEIPYERYPRTYIDPPSVELSIAENKSGEKILRSPAHKFVEEQDDALIHTINLFLEHFGECELLRENLVPVTPAQLIRLNWEVLPKGCMPWVQLQRHLKPIVDRQPKGNRAVIDKRHETISHNNPEFVAVGQSGFDGYVVFGFPAKQIYILESTQINNATYVLDRNWKDLSSMTKAELLNKDLHKERIIHREDWFAKIERVLNT